MKKFDRILALLLVIGLLGLLGRLRHRSRQCGGSVRIIGIGGTHTGALRRAGDTGACGRQRR